jgi:hypothetical protein
VFALPQKESFQTKFGLSDQSFSRVFDDIRTKSRQAMSLVQVQSYTGSKA